MFVLGQGGPTSIMKKHRDIHEKVGDWWVHLVPPFVEERIQSKEHKELVTCQVCGKQVERWRLKLHVGSLPCQNMGKEKELEKHGYVFLNYRKRDWLTYLEKADVKYEIIEYARKSHIYIPYWAMLVMNTIIFRNIDLEKSTQILRSVNENIVAKELVKKFAYTKMINKILKDYTQYVFLFGFDKRNLTTDMLGDFTEPYNKIKFRQIIKWIGNIAEEIVRDRNTFTRYELMEIQKTVENFVEFTKGIKREGKKTEMHHKLDPLTWIEKHQGLLEVVITEVLKDDSH